MIEFSNNAAFVPALCGFLGGAIFVSLISSVRTRMARLAAQAQERVTAEKVSNLKSEKSALETAVATLRASEARFIKHQGELEAQTKTREQHDEEMVKLVATLSADLQAKVKASEKSLLNAISKIPVLQRMAPPDPAKTATAPPPLPESPAPVDPSPTPPPLPDLSADEHDFVPLENIPTTQEKNPFQEKPTSTKQAASPGQSPDFEGFGNDQTDLKAESAANAFRAALRDTD